MAIHVKQVITLVLSAMGVVLGLLSWDVRAESVGGGKTLDYTELEVSEALRWQAHEPNHNFNKQFAVTQAIYNALYADLSRSALSEGAESDAEIFAKAQQEWGNDVLSKPWLRLAACLYTRAFEGVSMPSRQRLLGELLKPINGLGDPQKAEERLTRSVKSAQSFFGCTQDTQVERQRQKLEGAVKEYANRFDYPAMMTGRGDDLQLSTPWFTQSANKARPKTLPARAKARTAAKAKRVSSAAK